MKRQILLIISAFCLILLFNTGSAFAQIDVKGKVEEKTTNRVDQRVDEGIDKGLDGIENGIKGVFKKKDKSEDDETEEVENTEDDEMVGSDTDETEVNNDAETEEVKDVKKPDDKPKLESYTKYDFVPGDQILLFEDFSQDAIGDFPALWTTDGSGEVRTVNNAPGKWLYMSSDENVYCLMKDLAIPQNFIFEFDVIAQPSEDNDNTSFYLSFLNSNEDYMDDGIYPGKEGVNIVISSYNWDASGYAEEKNGTNNNSEISPIKKSEVQHVIIWVQNRRIRIYHDQQKVIDGPTLIHPGVSFNRIRFSQWGGAGHHFVSNLKITTASPDMRSKLLTEGRLVSYGIYFDSGKDIVKPESYGSLKEIAAVLTENPDVKIQIVGHTDSDGDDAMNLDLSKRRAANVKNSLVKDFGISADRIQTDGKGESVPLSPNTTVENKAKNRRVEFIKL